MKCIFNISKNKFISRTAFNCSLWEGFVFIDFIYNYAMREKVNYSFWKVLVAISVLHLHNFAIFFSYFRFEIWEELFTLKVSTKFYTTV